LNFCIFFTFSGSKPSDEQILRDSLVCPLDTVSYELIEQFHEDSSTFGHSIRVAKTGGENKSLTQQPLRSPTSTFNFTLRNGKF
jgi:hypothetical protein